MGSVSLPDTALGWGGGGVEHLGLEADWKPQLSLLVEKIPSQIQKILTKLLTWCQAQEREL